MSEVTLPTQRPTPIKRRRFNDSIGSQPPPHNVPSTISNNSTTNLSYNIRDVNNLESSVRAVESTSHTQSIHIPDLPTSTLQPPVVSSSSSSSIQQSSTQYNDNYSVIDLVGINNSTGIDTSPAIAPLQSYQHLTTSSMNNHDNNTSSSLPALPSLPSLLSNSNAAYNQQIAKLRKNNQSNRSKTTRTNKHNTANALPHNTVEQAAFNTNNSSTELMPLNHNDTNNNASPPPAKTMRDIINECKVLAGKSNRNNKSDNTNNNNTDTVSVITTVSSRPSTYPPPPPQPVQPQIGPRVQLDASGNIVVNTDSLLIDTPAVVHQPLQVVDEGDISASGIGYGHHQYVSQWSLNELKLFYRCIAQFGLDFSFIAQLYPNRTRQQIKSRYNKEERLRPQLVDMALNNKLPIDIEQFEYYVSHTVNQRDEKLKLEEQQQLQLIQVAQAERAARKEAKLQADAEKKSRRDVERTNQLSPSVLDNMNDAGDNNQINNDITVNHVLDDSSNADNDSVSAANATATINSIKPKKPRKKRSTTGGTIDEIIELSSIVPSTGSVANKVRAIAKQDHRNKQITNTMKSPQKISITTEQLQSTNANSIPVITSPVHQSHDKQIGINTNQTQSAMQTTPTVVADESPSTVQSSNVPPQPTRRKKQ